MRNYKTHIFVRGVEKSLSKFENYKGKVYRSIDSQIMKDEEIFNRQYQKGNIIICHAYTSASKEVYDESMKYQLVIKSKHGKDISNINVVEKEILFKRGSVFVVTERNGNIIYLEEV